MTTEKKDISQYLHFYLGCECMLEERIVVKLTGFENNKPVIKHPTKWEFAKVIDHELIKPLLYRLEDMPDEHKKELWQLVFKRTFPETGQIYWYAEKSLYADPRWVLMSGVERLGIEVGGDVWADSDLSKWKFNPHLVTHYLLSKGYDLFGLIDAGLAIDRKTLNNV